MKVVPCVLATLATLAASSPVVKEKRQLTGLLSSIAGVLGVDQSFDYIVLGGGTGGLTIAKRLAEDPDVTVAVIEAGYLYEIADPFLETTPAGDVTFVGENCTETQITSYPYSRYLGTKEVMPTVDWGFYTNPDPASDNIARAYARGKCLGGR